MACAAIQACRHQLRHRPHRGAGTTCQRQNEWYWQCLDGGSAAPSSGKMLAMFDQCGGKGGNCAQYACVDGQYPG
jgi:hypothetical protein